jgi:recyclin-1
VIGRKRYRLSLPTIRTQSPELILDDHYVQTSVHADASPLLATQQPSFLSSSSPAHLKSNVLSTFTNLLLIPVSIVPRTVETVSGAAVHGIAMLDPRRWGGAGQVNGNGLKDGYTKGADSTAVVLWEDEPEDSLEASSEHGEDTAAPASPSASPQPPRPHSYDNLQLLLSLDVTLELIHTTRESLKRVEIFSGYPGTYGVRVRETIEELATELLGGLGERHVRSGFELCVCHSFRMNERAQCSPRVCDYLIGP